MQWIRQQLDPLRGWVAQAEIDAGERPGTNGRARTAWGFRPPALTCDRPGWLPGFGPPPCLGFCNQHGSQPSASAEGYYLING